MEDGYLSRTRSGTATFAWTIVVPARCERIPKTGHRSKKYHQDLIDAYGPERGEFLFKTAGNPHTVFMPNLHLVNVADMRLLRPLAADKFEIYFFCAFLKDAPDELNEARIADVTARMVRPAASIPTTSRCSSAINSACGRCSIHGRS